MKEGERINLANLTVTKISFYESYLADGTQIEKCRTAFCDDHGKRYVYTGKNLALRTFDTVQVRGTVKCLRDGYGNTRLSRVKIRSRGREPGEGVLLL